MAGQSGLGVLGLKTEQVTLVNLFVDLIPDELLPSWVGLGINQSLLLIFNDLLVLNPPTSLSSSIMT